MAVFFDTLHPNAPTTERPFHDLEYCWDFGDTQSGAYAPTGASKNHASGPVSGHVFERPGTYVVSVSARNARGEVSSSAVELTVLDPDAVFPRFQTVCFSGKGNFDGCPASAGRVTASDLSALTPHVATNKRLLLRRDETFTVTTLRLNVRGPLTIGAFGSGARPRIIPTETAFRISDREPEAGHVTLMDLEIDGRGDVNARGVLIEGRANDVLVLRVRALRIADAFSAPLELIDHWNRNGYPGHDVVDGFSIVDSEARDLVGPGQFSYIGARRLLFAGNVYYDSTSGEHVIRTPWIERGALIHNDLGKAPSGRHVVKLHAPKFERPGVGSGKYSERIVFSDNIVRGTGGHAWSVAIGPQNAESDERVRDVVIERNLFLPGDAVRVALTLWGKDVSVRDNVFDRGTQPICAGLGRRGVEPAPERVSFANNVCYTTGPRPAELVELDGTAAGVSLHGNVLVGPSGARVELPGAEGTGNIALSPAEFEARPNRPRWSSRGLVRSDTSR